MRDGLNSLKRDFGLGIWMRGLMWGSSFGSPWMVRFKRTDQSLYRIYLHNSFERWKPAGIRIRLKHSRHSRNWGSRHLKISVSGDFGIWVFQHVRILAPENSSAWNFQHLEISMPVGISMSENFEVSDTSYIKIPIVVTVLPRPVQSANNAARVVLIFVQVKHLSHACKLPQRNSIFRFKDGNWVEELTLLKTPNTPTALSDRTYASSLQEERSRDSH